MLFFTISVFSLWLFLSICLAQVRSPPLLLVNDGVGDWFVARSRRKLDVKTLGYVAAIPPIINFIWILRCWNNIDTFTHQWCNGDCLFYFKSFLHWGIFDLETAWMLLYLYDVRMNRIILVCWSWSFCHSEKPLTQSRSWKVPRMV